jgi:hypothetical protein
MSGPEIQVLDDANHPDAKAGKNGNRKAGSLYDMIPTASPAKVVGEWNKVKILKKNNQVTVWQNGQLSVSYPSSGPGWEAILKDSKFDGWKDFGKYSSGNIGLQDHGNVVAYRKIKIRKL